MPASSRHYSDDLFPYRRQLADVTLVASDSTPWSTFQGSVGAWSEDEDDGVRALFRGARGARLLATHYPPEESDVSLLDRVRGDVGGFQADDLEVLEQLVDELPIDGVVAGHIHDNEGSPWTYSVGAGTRAYVMGRTGGVDGATPCIGVLAVNGRGKMRWTTRKIR